MEKLAACIDTAESGEGCASSKTNDRHRRSISRPSIPVRCVAFKGIARGSTLHDAISLINVGVCIPRRSIINTTNGMKKRVARNTPYQCYFPLCDIGDVLPVAPRRTFDITRHAWIDDGDIQQISPFRTRTPPAELSLAVVSM